MLQSALKQEALSTSARTVAQKKPTGQRPSKVEPRSQNEPGWHVIFEVEFGQNIPRGQRGGGERLASERRRSGNCGQ